MTSVSEAWQRRVDRRAILRGLTLGVLSIPFVGEALQATRVNRVGFLWSFPFDRGVVRPFLEAFEQQSQDGEGSWPDDPSIHPRASRRDHPMSNN